MSHVRVGRKKKKTPLPKNVAVGSVHGDARRFECGGISSLFHAIPFTAILFLPENVVSPQAMPTLVLPPTAAIAVKLSKGRNGRRILGKYFPFCVGKSGVIKINNRWAQSCVS